jgi:transposase-like protein
MPESPAEWRLRLQAAVQRSGRKRSGLAREVGIAPETLSRIVNGVDGL